MSRLYKEKPTVEIGQVWATSSNYLFDEGRCVTVVEVTDKVVRFKLNRDRLQTVYGSTCEGFFRLFNRVKEDDIDA